ncbi:MAG: hypothetical protein AAF653_21125, partial [Chloroflexota bacterium]
MTQRSQYIRGTVLVTIAIAAGIIGSLILSDGATLSAQSPEYPGPQWEYLELRFAQPVTFSSDITAGFFINGNFVVPENPEATFGGQINFRGTEGWELVSNQNSQIFVFKREIL